MKNEQNLKPRIQEEVLEYLRGILTHLGIEAELSVKETPEHDLFCVRGATTDRLYLKNGAVNRQIFDALLTLISAFYQKRNYRQRPFLEIEGFRKAREIHLGKVSKQVIEKIQGPKMSLKISGLNSFERRAFHLVVQNTNNADSESEGFGVSRKMNIFSQHNPS